LDRAEVDLFAGKVAFRLVDHRRDMRRRLLRSLALELRFRRRTGRVGQAKARDAVVTPRDSGEAELRFEDMIVRSHRDSRCVPPIYAAREIPPPVSSSFRRRPKLRLATGRSPA